MHLPADYSFHHEKLKIWNTIKRHELLILSFRTTNISHKCYQCSVARNRTNFYHCMSGIKEVQITHSNTTLRMPRSQYSTTVLKNKLLRITNKNYEKR